MAVPEENFQEDEGDEPLDYTPELLCAKKLFLAAAIAFGLSIFFIFPKNGMALFWIALLAGWFATVAGLEKASTPLNLGSGEKSAYWLMLLLPMTAVIAAYLLYAKTNGAIDAAAAQERRFALLKAKQRLQNRTANPKLQQSVPNERGTPTKLATSQGQAANGLTFERKIEKSEPTRNKEDVLRYLSKATAHVKVADTVGQDVCGGKMQISIPDVKGAKVEEESIPIMHFTDSGFGVVYFVDQNDSFAYVNRGDLVDAKMSVELLHVIGLKNLTNLTASTDAQAGLRIVQQDSFWGILLDGNYEASLVLLDDLWNTEEVTKLTPNGCVVTIPARDILAFCDAKSGRGIAGLKEVARKIAASGDHQLTSQLLIRKDGKWATFQQA